MSKNSIQHSTQPVNEVIMEQREDSPYRLGRGYAVKSTTTGTRIYPPVSDEQLDTPTPGAGSVVLSDDELEELIGWWLKRQARAFNEKGLGLERRIVNLVSDGLITRDIAAESIRRLIEVAAESALESWVMPEETD